MAQPAQGSAQRRFTTHQLKRALKKKRADGPVKGLSRIEGGPSTPSHPAAAPSRCVNTKNTTSSKWQRNQEGPGFFCHPCYKPCWTTVKKVQDPASGQASHSRQG